MTNLYNNTHSILVSSTKEKKKVNVKTEIETTNNGVNNRELFIRLTDADSLSFLFCLRINDENFQELKSQQGLLVDLCAFGQKLIDLLQLCKAEESSDCPKYILKMCGNVELHEACLPGANWTLNFIETNPFKHLTHLSLKFIHGDVDQFKNYLIDCLKRYRTENVNLSSQLKNTEITLTKKLRDAEMAVDEHRDQLQKLHITSAVQLEELRSKLEQQIDRDKDKLMETEHYYKTKNDQEKNDIEANFALKCRQYEAKIQDLDKTNKCLGEENSKLESDLRDMRMKHDNVDESYKRSYQEIQNIRRSKEQCDKTIHELECQMQKLATRVAVLEQEVRDKDQILSRTQDLYCTEQEAKNRCIDENQKRLRQNDKLEKAVKNLNDEVSKGNEIIQKLQNDIKHCHSKIKVRTQITAEQEKVLNERESQIKLLTIDLDNSKKELIKKENEVEKISLNFEQLSKKLEEANHVIKTNENVINWLNRQVTEYELSKQKPIFSTGLPPRSHQGTVYSASTDTTVKYRPMSSATNVSNVDSCANSVLSGIPHRGILAAGLAGAGSVAQSQAILSKSGAPTNSSPIPFSTDKMPPATTAVGLDAKYLTKSVIPQSGGWTKTNPTQQPLLARNLITGAPAIPEELEAVNSVHQQSLSSAYFPKQLLNPK